MKKKLSRKNYAVTSPHKRLPQMNLLSKMKIASFILLVTAVLSSSVFAQRVPIKNVAVVETQIDEQSGAESKITRAEVREITNEIRREAVHNLPRSRFNVMTSETVLSMGDAVLEECAEENCIIALGSKIGADYIVRGIVGKFQENITMLIEIYETEYGMLVATAASIRSANLNELLEKTTAASTEMYKKFLENSQPAAASQTAAPTYNVTQERSAAPASTQVLPAAKAVSQEDVFFPSKEGMVLTTAGLNAKGNPVWYQRKTIGNVHGSGGDMTINYTTQMFNKKRIPNTKAGIREYAVKITGGVLELDIAGNILYRGGISSILSHEDSKLHIPSTIASGSILENPSMKTVNSFSNTTTEFKFTNIRCVGVETVTVPAGTFEAYKVTMTIDQVEKTTGMFGGSGANISKYMITYWFVRGIGEVKSLVTSLNGKVMGSFELVDIEYPAGSIGQHARASYDVPQDGVRPFEAAPPKPPKPPKEPREPIKKSFWLGLTLDVVGAGMLAYGVIENDNAKNNLDSYNYTKAQSSMDMRNIAYIVGGAALLSGITIHIFF